MVPIHLLILAVTVIGIVLADKYGLSWVRGTTPTLDSKKLNRYHWWVGIGLAGMILTGAAMASGRPEDFNAQNYAFVAKLAFVGILVVNAFVIGALSKVATTRTYASLSTKEKIPLYLSAAASAIGWIGAITFAFFIGG